MHRFFYTLALMGALNGIAAQEDYRIYLQSGPLSTPETFDSIDRETLTANQFEQFYYLILQFYDVPTPTQEADLASRNITLLGYLPNYAYTAKIPVTADFKTFLNLRAILPIKPQYKLSQALATANYPTHTLSADSIKLMVYPYAGIAVQTLAANLQQNGYASAILHGDGIVVNAALCCVLDLAGHPGILFVETIEELPKAEGWNGRAAQRVNVVSGGPNLGYDGNGIALAIGDDGGVSHEDFKGRLTNHTAGAGGTHGDMTAGLAIGAGNLSPLGMGLAPNAHLHLYDINGYPHLEEAVSNLQQRGVVITSTSYGESCGGVYSQDAQSIDNQIFNNAALFHTFSAGNSGEQGCGIYGGIIASDGTRFGNITGGKKSAKNTIAVGNAEYDDEILSSSSRGPTADGRIKPDICAHGQGNISTDENNGYRSGGGTSAASPSLAGTAALLYQAYRERQGGANPSSALVKAMLLNTADDLGNTGPDYVSGWGRVHAGRAMEAVRNNWFLSANVTNGATRSHTLNIPSGTRQVRVMLYWHDPEGLPNAGKALVNDLDLNMKSPSGITFLPWVLSRAVHRDSLQKPAYRGFDRVNNMEQVTIDEPAAGNYTLEIKGQLVPRGPQTYFLVYCFVKEELTVAYPAGGEGFVPDETETIRWDALGKTGPFALEFSSDNGASWQFIATNINPNLRHFDWKVPKITATKALIRVSRNGKTAVSATPFCILQLPDFQFFNVSSTTTAMRWRKVPGANVYDVYALGAKHMEVIGTTADTSFQIIVTSGQRNWYSVRARHTNGATGRRATAKNYQHQSCDARVTLQLNFDLYPSETFWDVKDAMGRVLAAGGPYTDVPLSSTTNVEICLPYGCYQLNMYDSYSDGMCCQSGSGSYRLTNASGIVLASGGEFSNFRAHPFCVGQTSAAPLLVNITHLKHVSCTDARDGAVSASAAGGAGNYTYRWNTGATSASLLNLAAGAYSVTVSDGTQQVSTTVNISQPLPVNIQITTQQGSCTNEIDNTVTANINGGTPPYTYVWSNGSRSASLSGLNPGTYQLTVTDAQGCSQIASVQVQPAADLIVNLLFANARCFNSNDGMATASANGGSPPYTYQWSTGSTNAVVSGLSPGIHSVTVTDSKACKTVAAVNITAPTAINLSFQVTQAYGNSNGAINLSVNGGTPNYRFQWSNGATSEDLNNLGPGTYTVTVTDARGCTAVASQRIEFQEPVNCSARGSNTRFEWIERIWIGSFLHQSGSNGGYADFTNYIFSANRGSTYALTLVPGYASEAFREFWRVWIDFNRDGDFVDAGEEVLSVDGVTHTVSSNFTIVNHAVSGTAKMRVSMRYGGAAMPCGTFPYGEVEDYTIYINSSNVTDEEIALCTSETSPGTSNSIHLFPNPARTQATLQYETDAAGDLEYTIYDLQGKLQRQQKIQLVKGRNSISLSLENLSAGTYLIKGKHLEFSFMKRLVVL